MPQMKLAIQLSQRRGSVVERLRRDIQLIWPADRIEGYIGLLEQGRVLQAGERAFAQIGAGIEQTGFPRVERQFEMKILAVNLDPGLNLDSSVDRSFPLARAHGRWRFRLRAVRHQASRTKHLAPVTWHGHRAACDARYRSSTY
jgi:hypothetical protein